MRDRQTAETGARPSTGNDRPVPMMAGRKGGEKHDEE